MTQSLDEGQFVEHATWGRGLIVLISPPYMEIHFPSLGADPSGPRRKLPLNTNHVTVSAVQSDPNFAAVRVGPARSARAGAGAKLTKVKPPKVMAHNVELAIRWFKSEYPGLFDDPLFIKREIKYKRDAHQLFVDYFGGNKGKKLLQSGSYAEIGDGLVRLYSATNIPSKFEIMAARDGLKDEKAAARLLEALLEFLEKPTSEAFDRLAGDVAGLPAPAKGSRVLTWPNVTILPFLADPSRFIVLKPRASKTIAARMNLEFSYSTAPTWPTYHAFLRVAEALLETLQPLGAKDFIDVQSFMWATRDLD